MRPSALLREDDEVRAYLLDEALALRLRIERDNASGTSRSGNGRYVTEADVVDWATEVAE